MPVPGLGIVVAFNDPKIVGATRPVCKCHSGLIAELERSVQIVDSFFVGFSG